MDQRIHDSWYQPEKRSLEDADASSSNNSKRFKANGFTHTSLSKAGQTLLHGAGELLGLSADQLIEAATQYRNQFGSSASDSITQLDTPSDSTCQTTQSPSVPATDDSTRVPVRLPFPLTLPDLSLRPQYHSQPTVSNEYSTPDADEHYTALHQDNAVTSWLEDEFHNALPLDLDWCRIFSRYEPGPLINTFNYPNELEIDARDDHFEAQLSVPTQRDSLTPIPQHPAQPPVHVSQDWDQRNETRWTRKKGACIRCRMQKIKCIPDSMNSDICCLPCGLIAGTRQYWVPCLRYKIGDANLLDHDKCPRASWTLRFKSMEMKEIAIWASDKTKIIECTQDVLGSTFSIKVRKFVPVQGDALARKWKVNGVQKSFECPPYGIADMQQSARVLARHVDTTTESAIRYYIDEVEGSDQLLRDTYRMAYRQSRAANTEEERHLLVSALRLWNASRIACRSDRIVGEETLGMTRHKGGPDDPNNGIVLTPPVFSAQLEIIITATLLTPAKKAVLKRLHKLIQVGERQCWLTIYLAMFILLHNCALLTNGDNKKARKQGLNARFFRPSLVEGLHNGAKVLLAHFHYNNRGSYPFRIDWSSHNPASPIRLDEDQVAFMRNTAAAIEQKGEMFQRIRQQGNYEHDYYFISQLYDADWRPTTTI